MLFGSTILELAIGVIFIYLMLSLICSAANEFLAANTKRRSWMLEQGVRNLLLDSNLNKRLTPNALKEKRIEISAAPVAKGAPAAGEGAGGAAAEAAKAEEEAQSTRNVDEGAATLSNIFYAHPLIKSLYQPRWFRLKEEKKPAYIPARTFALTLLDIITPEQPGRSKTIADVRAAVEKLPQDSDLRRTLLTFIDEAEGDIEKLRANVEDWFNVGMDRVSDWYKRRTHRIIFILGLVLAIALNADTIMILKVLYSEPAVRTALLAQAQAYNATATATPTPATSASPAPSPTPQATPSGQPTPTPDVSKEIEAARKKLDDSIKAYRELENLGLPVGWSNQGAQVARRPMVDIRDKPWRFAWEWALKILGLLITGVALSMGAPFWFDLLNRFISFRTALKPPEATPEKRGKSMSLTTPPRPPDEPGSSAGVAAGQGKKDDNQAKEP